MAALQHKIRANALVAGGVGVIAVVVLLTLMLGSRAGDAGEPSPVSSSHRVPAVAVHLASPLVMWQQTLEEDVREALEAEDQSGAVRLPSSFVDEFISTRLQRRRR